MKNKKKILCIGLACAAALTASLFTGCESINDFQNEHPVAYDALTGAAKLALKSQVPAITDDVVYQSLLNSTIDAAFLAAATPDGVASELESGVAAIYPNDPELQGYVVDEFVQALTAPSDSTVPASGPDTAFKRALADALAPNVSYDYTPDLLCFATLDDYGTREFVMPETREPNRVEKPPAIREI